MDLAGKVGRGEFREELFHALNILPVIVPSLREREDDVLLLARYFLEKYRARSGKYIPGFTQEALDALRTGKLRGAAVLTP